MNSKESFYDTIAEDFDSIMNMYDANRRIQVIFDDFLGNVNLTNKTLLDGGCGTGLFTERALERGAVVTSVDISTKLLEITKKRSPKANVTRASLLNLPFKDNSFDIVISSDVIEHTDDPFKATDELIRVLKPKGLLCVTVPNKSFWYFSLVLAQLLRLRQYRGNENWVNYNQYKRYLKSKYMGILEYKGIHLFPFVFPVLNGVLRRLDRIFDQTFGCIMVNIAALAKK